MPAIKGRYWLCTLSVQQHSDQPTLSNDCCYLKGQKEIGDGGFEHWQFLAVFSKQVTLQQAKQHFHNTCHLELSRSAAANDYVWKEDTRVEGSQFELGQLPKSRARKADWDQVWNDAISGDFNNIPKDILIRNYSSIKRIRVDNVNPPFRDNIIVNVFWGESGTGKTRRAWHEAGDPSEVYIKNPNTKWWDGYKGQKTVIIDEFTGRIDWSYLALWFDRYPCNVEVKGFSTPLLATTFFITSNVNPYDWFQDLNSAQKDALTRRFTNCEHFTEEWLPPQPNLPNSPNLTPEVSVPIRDALGDNSDTWFANNVLPFISGSFN